MEVESNPSFFFDSILKRRRTVAWILMCSLRCRETKYWHLSNIFTVTILYFHCDNGALRSAFNFSFEHTTNFCLCDCNHVGHGAFWWQMTEEHSSLIGLRFSVCAHKGFLVTNEHLNIGVSTCAHKSFLVTDWQYNDFQENFQPHFKPLINH